MEYVFYWVVDGRFYLSSDELLACDVLRFGLTVFCMPKILVKDSIDALCRKHGRVFKAGGCF